MSNGPESSGWRRTLVKSLATVMVTVVVAAAVVLILHDDPSQLDEPIDAMFDGIVRVLTLLLGAGGVAVGAYHSGRSRGNGADRLAE